MITSVTFETTLPTTVQSIDEAIEHMKPLFAPNTFIVIHEMRYDYVSSYGQSKPRAIRLDVKGVAWNEQASSSGL